MSDYKKEFTVEIEENGDKANWKVKIPNEFIHFFPVTNLETIKELYGLDADYADSHGSGCGIEGSNFAFALGIRQWPCNLLNTLWEKIASDNGEILAVYFSADRAPDYASLDEIVWRGPVGFHGDCIVPAREAVEALGFNEIYQYPKPSEDGELGQKLHDKWGKEMQYYEETKRLETLCQEIEAERKQGIPSYESSEFRKASKELVKDYLF